MLWRCREWRMMISFFVRFVPNVIKIFQCHALPRNKKTKSTIRGFTRLLYFLLRRLLGDWVRTGGNDWKGLQVIIKVEREHRWYPSFVIFPVVTCNASFQISREEYKKRRHKTTKRLGTVVIWFFNWLEVYTVVSNLCLAQIWHFEATNHHLLSIIICNLFGKCIAAISYFMQNASCGACLLSQFMLLFKTPRAMFSQLYWGN